MTREEARKAAEIMLAYANGQEIEVKTQWGWTIHDHPHFDWDNKVDSYRIKPMPKNHPFTSIEECWEEMKKHTPFGWVKDRYNNDYVQIQYISKSDDENEVLIIHFSPDEELNEVVSANKYVFADGMPFGIIEEEK